MRRFFALVCFGSLVTGCAAGQQERQPSRPIWFQKTDFVRPGNASTWQNTDPPLSVCGEICGGLLKTIAKKP